MPINIVSSDLSGRPFRLTSERTMRASSDALFRAWTEQFDRWFAAPGTLLMRARSTLPSFSRLTLVPSNCGTLLHLTHAGFPDEESKNRHEQAA